MTCQVTCVYPGNGLSSALSSPSQDSICRASFQQELNKQLRAKAPGQRALRETEISQRASTLPGPTGQKDRETQASITTLQKFRIYLSGVGNSEGHGQPQLPCGKLGDTKSFQRRGNG